jgi:hypothetical protein
MRQTKRTIHLRVKELTEARGIDERELAGRARVDVRVIRRMFAGQEIGKVLLHQLMKVADALEVEVCELIQTIETRDGDLDT